MPRFQLIKNNNREPKERDEYRAKIIRHRLVFIYKVLFVAAVIVAIAAGLYISYVNKQYTDYEIVSDEDRMDSDDAIYIPYNGCVLKYSQDGAEAYDGYNNAIWNATFEMQNPQVDVCGRYAAIGDFKGTTLYVVGFDGAMGEIDTKLPISSFCVSDKGVAAVVLEDDNETRINLYSSSGEKLAEMKCTMTRSGYPVDVSLSPDGIKLCVSYMRIQNGELKSSVAFYNFGEVGQNEIDNYVSGYDYIDSIVPIVKFINDDTAFSIADNRLVIYKGSQKPTSSFEAFINDEVKSVFYGDKSIALVFNDSTADGLYRVDVYDDKGEIKLSQSIDMEYTDIVLKDDLMIVYNDTDCIMYRFNKDIKYIGSFKEPMLLVVPQSTTKWTLANRDTIQSVKLK